MPSKPGCMSKLCAQEALTMPWTLGAYALRCNRGIDHIATKVIIDNIDTDVLTILLQRY